MRVLIACEFSGIVREAFRKQGHDAWSCDLLDTEIPGQHIKGDVLKVLNYGWDMMIIHDPCTYQCNSGVRWLHTIPSRMELLKQSCLFTRILLSANIKKIARENPIPHRYAVQLIGINYTQLVQPHYFGDLETKATCFWLKGVDKLVRTHFITQGIKDSVHQCSPCPNRWKERSRTLPGLAYAMAEQWGKEEAIPPRPNGWGILA